MTTAEIVLWKKIASFRLNHDSSSFQFSHRLARENGWTISYSEKVILEYKKFIFLCCVSQTGVTPSDQVDQAWHLHLTYTQSYWTDLCQNTLAKEIHHTPTKGGHAEGKKFDELYTATLQLYKDKFNTAPLKAIWPDNKKRFSDIHFQRVNLKNYWLLRKPRWGKNSAAVIMAVVSAMLFLQSQSTGGTGKIIGLFVLLGLALWGILSYKNGGGGWGGSGCSTSGCGGQSGCGGYSGCGGSGCGGD